jgi:thymidylate synthase
MNNTDEIYHDLLKKVLKMPARDDRTGTGTHSLFGAQLRFRNTYEYFPLVSTKKVFFKGVVHELLWMLSGDTNIKPLVDAGVNIWNDWPLKNYNDVINTFNFDGIDRQLTMEQYINKIKTDDAFASKWGDCGPIYGYQWRKWPIFNEMSEEYGGNNSIDQIQLAVDTLKNNPNSRRIIVNTWNVADIEDMQISGLPPCHMMFQFYTREVEENRMLDCQVYIRSNDLFLGAPFNIAQYALLMHIIAKNVGMIPGDLVYTIGDAHIYTNHVEAVKQQLDREMSHEPITVRIAATEGTPFTDIKPEHIVLEGYNPQAAIKAKVAV